MGGAGRKIFKTFVLACTGTALSFVCSTFDIMKLLCHLITFVFLASQLAAQTAAPFKSGDRWCVLGDSITHGGRYQHLIYLFYATRFPGQKIDIFNCGISGDSAGGALRRLEDDVLSHKPSVVSIMLGMNDVSRNLYEPGAPSPEVVKRREKALADHAQNMKQLAEKLTAAGARLIFLTPTPFDDTSTMEKPNLPGVNHALSLCADNARLLAKTFNGGLVDFHSFMTDLNLGQQKQDPHYTLIGPDRVHPQDVGHLVMTYLFLKAQGISPFVSTHTEDAAGKSDIEFSYTESALPFPVPAGCLPALKLVPFMDELNQEQLKVTGLQPGKYKVVIDAQPIASFEAEQLAKGINLATLNNTPQYLQALAAAKIDDQRSDLVKRLRTIDYVEWRMGRKIGDMSTFDYAADAQKFISNPKNEGYVAGQGKAYLTLKPKQAEMQAQLGTLVEDLSKACQPKPHRFHLVREDGK